MFWDEFDTSFPVASTSVMDKGFPLSPLTRLKDVCFPFVSRKWTIQYCPSDAGSALINRIFGGQPVINDPSQLLSPVPDPGSTLVKYGTLQPHPNLVAKPFETSDEVVR